MKFIRYVGVPYCFLMSDPQFSMRIHDSVENCEFGGRTVWGVLSSIGGPIFWDRVIGTKPSKMRRILMKICWGIERNVLNQMSRGRGVRNGG